MLNVSIQHSSYCNPNVLCSYEWFRTLAVRMDGSKPRTLLNDDGARKNVQPLDLLAARTTRPGTVTMSTWDYKVAQQHWSSVVFEVETRTGKEKVLASGTPNTEDWVVDAPATRSPAPNGSPISISSR